MGIKVELLEDHPYALTHPIDVGPGIHQILAFDDDGSMVGLFEPVAAAQQRRFSGPRRPDDEDEFTLSDRQVDGL